MHEPEDEAGETVKIPWNYSSSMRNPGDIWQGESVWTSNVAAAANHDELWSPFWPLSQQGRTGSGTWSEAERKADLPNGRKNEFPASFSKTATTLKPEIAKIGSMDLRCCASESRLL
ncbi:hypothetical protein N7539_006951 [Penicillium diatomitis]|uniref:Uncharacterized protein n=1 Tax=Penicillium diatomitis TaxID=2819901 RepID=A0A9X0BSS2_9EURO|nr:uncharacterized protein N7539_006951 [Penicillium diatomitis]KAJ5481057.1 hypothetical protein N7539_006951 [Penicillium diatomitis]